MLSLRWNSLETLSHKLRSLGQRHMFKENKLMVTKWMGGGGINWEMEEHIYTTL